VRGFAFGRRTEPFIPSFDRRRERVAQRQQLADARLDLAQLSLRQRAHLAARRVTRGALAKDPRELVARSIISAV